MSRDDSSVAVKENRVCETYSRMLAAICAILSVGVSARVLRVRDQPFKRPRRSPKMNSTFTTGGTGGVVKIIRTMDDVMEDLGLGRRIKAETAGRTDWVPTSVDGSVERILFHHRIFYLVQTLDDQGSL